ncbi:hypothetical protein [Pseudonocardia oroxyli]|uniref:Uncharacterized protein n=1 Tax=Pseudonocardia oroxyli TaxID=366584 RepID=A0A1G7GA58_PSEOR|nr:hypothetical protein [Pseudonocardia oroxyli]SDE84965.1 hypothetical protein SAMN05216377_102272 [Pseudonocardia oroxyli]
MTSTFPAAEAPDDRRILGPRLSAGVVVVLSVAAIVGIGLSGGGAPAVPTVDMTPAVAVPARAPVPLFPFEDAR